MKTVDSIRPKLMLKNGVLYKISYEISQETADFVLKIKNRKHLAGWRLYVLELALILVIFFAIEFGEIFFK